MMKFLITLIIMFSPPAIADYSFKISNDTVQSNKLSLGSISLNLCESVGLNLSNFSDAGVPARCFNYIQDNLKGVELIIPVRVSYSSSTNTSIDIHYKVGGQYPFDYFDLKSVRNGQIGGGVSVLNTSVPMKDGDTFLYELEVRAIITRMIYPYFDNYLIINLVAE